MVGELEMGLEIKSIVYEIDIEIDQNFSLKENAPVDLDIIQKDFDSCLKNIDLIDPEYKELNFINSYDIVINDSEVTYDNDSDETKENDLIERILKYKVNLELDGKSLDEFMIYLTDSAYFETPKKTIWLENDTEDYRDMIIGGLIFHLTNGTSDTPEKSSFFAPDYTSKEEFGDDGFGHESFVINEIINDDEELPY